MTTDELRQKLYFKLVPHPQTDPPEIVKAGHSLYNQIVKEMKLAEKERLTNEN